MIYLVEPTVVFTGKPCKTDCPTLCMPVFCAIKPLYGIGP